MDTTVGADDIADTSDIQGIGCPLERFLHLPRSKPAKVTTIAVWWAIWMLRCQFCKHFCPVWSFVNLRLVILQHADRFFLSASNVCLSGNIRKINGQEFRESARIEQDVPPSSLKGACSPYVSLRDGLPALGPSLLWRDCRLDFDIFPPLWDSILFPFCNHSEVSSMTLW